MLEMPGLTSLVTARSDHNVLAKQNIHTLHASNSVRVHVNKDNLALTPHPFKVVSMNNLVSLDGKDAYSGYAVFMRVHPCDVLGEGKKRRFKCTCRRCDASSLCISAPALDFADNGGDDDAMRCVLTTSGDDEDERLHAAPISSTFGRIFPRFPQPPLLWGNMKACGLT